MALKRKKGYETQYDRVHGTIVTLEQQLMTIESAKINADALKSMKAGAGAMKKMQDGMTIEQVDNIMMDVEEQQEVANEIGDALAQGIYI